MHFSNWLEQKWFEFRETVTLYHGSSSALIPTFKKEGIKPPHENLKDYALHILQQYHIDPNESYYEPAVKRNVSLIEWINKNVLSFRMDTPLHKTSNVIYLAPNFKQAAEYAKIYYQHGGEIAFEVWRAINVIKSRQAGLPRMKILVQPIYQTAQPIVLKVQIPTSWIKTYHNLEEKLKSAMEIWEKLYKKDYQNFNDFLAHELSNFEVRVQETIPPEMIKKIIPVTNPNDY